MKKYAMEDLLTTSTKYSEEPFFIEERRERSVMGGIFLLVVGNSTGVLTHFRYEYREACYALLLCDPPRLAFGIWLGKLK